MSTRPTRTGYVDKAGVYHPGPSYRGFDEHADACALCDSLRYFGLNDDYVDRRARPLPARAVQMPIPGPWPDPVRLSRRSRFCAWFRFRPASWPTARLVRR